jgi:membrane-associated phospholipid phosphatase
VSGLLSGPGVEQVPWNVTAFGHVELVAPLVCGVAVAFWLVDQKKNATRFFAGFLLCLAAIVVAKLVLMVAWRGGSLRSPSGHAAISAYLYGSVAAMIVASSRTFLARALAAALALLVLAIAISRFAIGGHSRTETLVGLVIGSLCVWVFSRRFARFRRPALPALATACIVGVAVAGALHWLLAPGYVDEETIWGIARKLRGLLRAA